MAPSTIVSAERATLRNSGRVVRYRAAASLLLAVALLVAPRPARADDDAANSCAALESAASVYLAVVMNGQCVNLSDLIRAGEKPGTAQAATAFTIGNQGVVINAFWDADPFLTFSVATTNPTAGAISYQFTFGTPVVPALYSYAEATLTGSVTGTGSVTNTAGMPVFMTGFGENGGAPTSLGVGVGTGPCVAPTVTCGNATLSNTFAPITFNILSATLSYTQTGLGSTASFTGRIDLFETPPTTTVPEPSTYALVAFGIVAAGVARRRRPAVR